MQSLADQVPSMKELLQQNIASGAAAAAAAAAATQQGGAVATDTSAQETAQNCL